MAILSLYMLLPAYVKIYSVARMCGSVLHSCMNLPKGVVLNCTYGKLGLNMKINM